MKRFVIIDKIINHKTNEIESVLYKPFIEDETFNGEGLKEKLSNISIHDMLTQIRNQESTYLAASIVNDSITNTNGANSDDRVHLEEECDMLLRLKEITEDNYENLLRDFLLVKYS